MPERLPTAPGGLLTTFKQWALDVGFWEAEDVTAWRWRAFRPCFWDTYTNQIHRTYRAILSEAMEMMAGQIKEAYIQGLKDGSLQTREIIRSERTDWTPDTQYVN